MKFSIPDRRFAVEHAGQIIAGVAGARSGAPGLAHTDSDQRTAGGGHQRPTRRRRGGPGRQLAAMAIAIGRAKDRLFDVLVEVRNVLFEQRSERRLQAHRPSDRRVDLAPWELVTQAPEIVRKLLAGLSDDDYEIHDEIAVHRTAVVEAGAVLKAPLIIGAHCFIAAGAYLRGG